jgi:hypothetical protein
MTAQKCFKEEMHDRIDESSNNIRFCIDIKIINFTKVFNLQIDLKIVYHLRYFQIDLNIENHFVISN